MVVGAEVDALRARGHTVTLLCTRGTDLPQGGALHLLLVAGNPLATRALARALDEHEPDIVHVHNLFPGWGPAALSVLIQRRQPAVQTLHNVRYLCPAGTQLRGGAHCTECSVHGYWSAVRYGCFRGSRVQSGFYALAMARIAKDRMLERAFGRVICVSQHQARIHQEAGLPREKLVVKGHFVRGVPATSDPDPACGFFAGRVETEKGFDVLAEALVRTPGMRLRVAGDGSGRRRWAPVLGDRVEWLGWLPHERIAHEMGRAGFCVMPSLSESFGLTALEAFACGRAVIASDAGGLGELVTHAETGLVSAAGDVDGLVRNLVRITQQPEEARRMGENARRLALERFGERANMDQLEDIYRGVMRTHGAVAL